MGKKSGPSDVAPPDPAATAAAQTQMNKDAAIANANLNRVNTTTPTGTDTWTVTGTNSDGTPKYERTIALSKDQQAAYDQQNNVTKQAYDLAAANFGRVNDAQKTPFNYDGMTDVKSRSLTNDLPALQSGVTPGQVQNTYDSGGNIQRTYDSGGTIQQDVAGSGDFSADRKAVTDAVYSQAKRNLDPQYQAEETQVANNLANRGIPVGSPAFTKQMDDFRRNRDSAYADANDRSIQTGIGAQQALAGIDLNAGQFHNAATAQGEQQNQQRATFGNTAQQQAEDQAATRAGFANSAESQQFGEQSQAMQLANAARSQGFSEDLSRAQYDNAQTSADRARQIAEASYLRTLPIQEVSALMGTGQIQQPTFGATPQVSYQAGDMTGLAASNYAAQAQMFSASQAASAERIKGMYSAIGGIGSAGIGAIAMSDRRAKMNIAKIGKLANGLPVYSYELRATGEPQIGLMADEVRELHPDAVIRFPDGFDRVNYDLAVR